jgi:glycosyltransferase involved in cell wall biosynthesis
MKGQRFLLEALAKLRTEYPDLKLVLIGRLKEGSIAQRTIEELGLWDAVEFVSGVSDERIVELYNESACAVVPSLYEGFSLPAIEAMATGCPLVATTGGALPEVTGSDGETCYSVAPADSEALATGIRRAFDDPEGSARYRCRRPRPGDHPLELAQHRRTYRRALSCPSGRELR